MDEPGGHGDHPNLAALHIENLRAACGRSRGLLRLNRRRHDEESDDADSEQSSHFQR